jgi:tetratricopeptide (TPR) repeat protein
MYYRYKSKKQSGRKYKVIAFIIIAACVMYPLYHFREYLQIWKYSINKIEKQITKAEKVHDAAEKKNMLLKAVSLCDDYEDGNPLSPEPFYLEARAWAGIAEVDSGDDFSAFITDDRKSSLSESAKASFRKALQSANKGMSLDQKSRPDDNTLIVVAKAYFYLDYYSPEEVRKVLDQVRNPAELKSIGERKFFGLMKIAGGDPDGGVRYLSESAGIQGSPEGKLFIASAYSIAKQYTNAIMAYKSVVDANPSGDIVVKAKVGLGKVYLTQQLYKEALAQCDDALKIDDQNISVKTLGAKVYFALGDRINAKKIAADLVSKGVTDKEITDIATLP